MVAAGPLPPTRRRRSSPAHPTARRRTTLLPITGLAWGPGTLLVQDSLRGDALGDAAAPSSGSSGSSNSSASASLRLNPGLATVLLAAPLTALQQR